MKNEKQYEDIISKIRATEPVLGNGDALTADIVSRIKILQARDGYRRRLIIAGRTSAAAAVILLGLLTGELSVATRIPPAVDANHINIGEYFLTYQSMPKEELLETLAERRERSAAIMHAKQSFSKNPYK